MRYKDFKTIEMDGAKFRLVPIAVFDSLIGKGGPQLPAADANGTRDALETSRVLMAQKITRRRKAAGLSQRALAELAGIAFESLNRIETAKVQPEVATIIKIDKALAKAEKSAK